MLPEVVIDQQLTYIQTFATTASGVIIPRFVGTLSAISSIIIISIIARSKTRLSSPYHRILFGMSFADVIASAAVAFTTLPMPADMIYTQFQGKSIGNTWTCAIQGYAANTYFHIGAFYNFGLCLYYLCAIPFKMSDKKFQKRVEPFIHIGIQLITMPAAITNFYWKVSLF